jgi:hypothetical protein
MLRRLIPRTQRPDKPDGRQTRRRRPASRRTGRLAAVLASLVLAPLVVVGAASPASASAAFCVQPGHAYLIHDGRAYYSGYEGDYRFGIQYLVLPRGTPVQVGAAGLLPDSFAEFNLHTGDAVPPDWIVVQRLDRPKVMGNCVINQRWVYPHPDLIGTYQLRVNYRGSWNGGAAVQETEVFVIFI